MHLDCCAGLVVTNVNECMIKHADSDKSLHVIIHMTCPDGTIKSMSSRPINFANNLNLPNVNHKAQHVTHF